MKTHMSNTKALDLANDIVAKTTFAKHQQALHSHVKPAVVTRRKEEIKIVNNHKKEINQNPKQHVNHLFKNLHANKYKSTLDNHAKHYDEDKKLLKDKLKKNKQENYAKNEHERELRSQASRVQNCKTMTQRKKDKTDPIVNPTYLMREGSAINSVTIDQYCRKVAAKNRPSSGIPSKQIHYLDSGSAQLHQQPHQNYVFGNVPDLSKQRPQSANHASRVQKSSQKMREDLPGCTFREILNHIVERKMFKDADLKVLYVRLCHKYSEEQIDEVWDVLMDELEK